VSLHFVSFLQVSLTNNYSQTVILDFCHAGGFVGEGYEYAASASHVLLTSCSRSESAVEHDGRGRFSQTLVRGLRSLGTSINTVTYKDVLGLLEPIPYVHLFVSCKVASTFVQKIPNTSVQR